MNRLLMTAGLLVLGAPLALAQTSTWTTDPMHSEVDFSVLHLSLSRVHGRFGKIAGTIKLNAADISRSSVLVTIDASTVDTGETARDQHLKSADFFDVAHYPVASFVSTSVARRGGSLVVTGNLTLHGVTRPVTLAVEGPQGPVTGMDHKPHEGYSATATISRLAFGIGPKFPNAVVGDEIQLTIELDAVKQ
jgi:polyisoprenoid-binding protein YceI